MSDNKMTKKINNIQHLWASENNAGCHESTGLCFKGGEWFESLSKKKQTLTMMKMKYCKYTIILATAVNQSCECFYLISPLTIIAKLLMDWPESQNHHTYVFGLKMWLFGFSKNNMLTKHVSNVFILQKNQKFLVSKVLFSQKLRKCVQ